MVPALSTATPRGRGLWSTEPGSHTVAATTAPHGGRSISVATVCCTPLAVIRSTRAVEASATTRDPEGSTASPVSPWARPLGCPVIVVVPSSEPSGPRWKTFDGPPPPRPLALFVPMNTVPSGARAMPSGAPGSPTRARTPIAWGGADATWFGAAPGAAPRDHRARARTLARPLVGAEIGGDDLRVATDVVGPAFGDHLPGAHAVQPVGDGRDQRYVVLDDEEARPQLGLYSLDERPERLG